MYLRTQSMNGLGHFVPGGAWRRGDYYGAARQYDTGMGFFLFDAIAAVAKPLVSLAGKAVGAVAGTVIGTIKGAISTAKSSAAAAGQTIQNATFTIHTSAGDFQVDTSVPGWETQLQQAMNTVPNATLGKPGTGQVISAGGIPTWLPWAGLGVAGVLLVVMAMQHRR